MIYFYLRGGLMSGNSLVVKHNDLINAKYKLSLNEQKIMLYTVSKIDRESDKFNIVELDIKEFTRLIGTTPKRFTEIKEITNGLRNRDIEIYSNNKKLISKWVASIEYVENAGTIEIEFSTKLIPYLLQLKGRFTQYELQNIVSFKNKYSIRLYELMKQYENIGKREFELDDLKQLLGCEDMYAEFKKFNINVLKKATKEINTYTDLNVDYEKITRGRKVIGLKFTVCTKKDEQEALIEELYSKEEIENIRIKSGLDNNRFNNKQIMELYTISVQQTDNMEVDPFEYIRLNYHNMIQKGAVKSPFAYFKKALEQDFAKAKNQLKFKFDIYEDKIRELKDQIDRADNSFVRQILQKELDALLNQ